MSSLYRDFYFYLSSDLDLDVKVFVGDLDLSQLPHLRGSGEDLVISVRLVDGGLPLHPCSRATKLPVVRGSRAHWDEWLALPIKIRDLPRTAQLLVELRGVGMELLGGATVRCFDHKARLKRGRQSLVVWPTLPAARSSSDAVDSGPNTESDTTNAAQQRIIELVRSDKAHQLMKLLERYDAGDMPASPWTDRLLFAQLRRELLSTNNSSDDSSAAAASLVGDGSLGAPYLTLHFPSFDHPVIFEETRYPGGQGIVGEPVPPLVPPMRTADGAIASSSGGGAGAVPYWYEGGILTVIRDPEAESEWDNPVEAKYHRLARGIQRGLADPNLKPNRAELSRIQEALSAPALDAKLPRDVQDLLWKFRYYITSNKHALTRFLCVVDWEVEDDVREATALLARWAPIDTDHALRLLSFDFPYRPVREHAVSALRRASDDDLVLYLLQLVQALRYEDELQSRPEGAVPRSSASSGNGAGAGGANSGASGAAAAPSSASSGAYRLSPLADFLVDRACASAELANFLHWYLKVESDDPRLGHVFQRVHSDLVERLKLSFTGRAIDEMLSSQARYLLRLGEAISAATGSKKDSVAAKIDKLNGMLSPGGAYGDLCSLPEPVAMPLNPRIRASGVHPKGCNIFKSALYPTVVTHAVHPGSSIDWTAPPEGVGLKVADAAVAAAIAAKEHRAHHNQHRDSGSGGSSSRNLQRARSGGGFVVPSGSSAGSARGRLSSPAGANDADLALTSVGDTVAGADVTAGAVGVPVPVVLQPAVDNEEAAAIASAVGHATPTGTPPATYKVIFKNGDDMRQDQLIIQMIRLMDAQLKRVGLDLQLMPYRVLATGPTSGMMELVLSAQPVSAVLSSYNNDIKAFFRAHHPAPDREYGIDPEVMDNYVKSAAGYAVVTYLLGIGDRHLDNIMLRSDGHLFHIDFGYIFGRDPKPFPAAVRITKEMIDGMGGISSANYQRFCRYCGQAYNILRKSANLVLSLLNLMRDAGISALAEQPDTTLAKVSQHTTAGDTTPLRFYWLEASRFASSPAHVTLLSSPRFTSCHLCTLAAAREVPPGHRR